jgi:polyferredoxin
MLTARKISQILFLAFFLFLFLQARYPYETIVDSDFLLRFSPLIPVFDFIQHLHISLLFWPALIILVATVFAGRFFCSWICPLGTTLDAAGHLLKSPSNKISAKWQHWRYLKFAILTGLVFMAIFSIHIWGYFDPLSIFNRALTILFYPLATLLGEKILTTLSNIHYLDVVSLPLYDQYKNWLMPENQAFYQQVWWIFIFIVTILAAEKITRRFWCRYLCPAGALLGFLSQFRFYERLVGPECTQCNKCQRECKMNAIPANDIPHTNKVECIECFNCGDACPPKAKSISYRWKWRPYHSKVDFERRRFMQTSAASMLALGLIHIGLPNRGQKNQLIRPPGSLPEDDFLDRCIRCQACVRICESNGGCLQPDQVHDSVLQLWAPVAVMREGYCEYNCNLCAQVCPTEAIRTLSLSEKQRTPMGLAHFDKNLCIPFARNEDCIVCEEHCPTPDKAIKFEIRDYTAPDGKTRKVKYPFVIKELCIGCGICETKCPLKGAAGIFVTAENEKRISPENDLASRQLS